MLRPLFPALKMPTTARALQNFVRADNNRARDATDDIQRSVETVQVCRHGCILFRGDHADRSVCPTCYSPRANGHTVSFRPLLPHLVSIIRNHRLREEFLKWNNTTTPSETHIRRYEDSRQYKVFAKRSYSPFTFAVQVMYDGMGLARFSAGSYWPLVGIQ